MISILQILSKDGPSDPLDLGFQSFRRTPQISWALSPESVPDGTSFQESERGCLIDENFGKTQPLMGSAGVKCSKVGTVWNRVFWLVQGVSPRAGGCQNRDFCPCTPGIFKKNTISREILPN
jgi:hypothetical protein